MDTIRGIAILMVVFHHAVAVLDVEWFGDGAPEWLTRTNAVFAPFRMPILMCLSGMLLAASLRKPAGAFFRGKLEGIGWPYVVWSLISLAILGALSAEALVRVLLVPPTVYWYLWFLLAFYVLAFVLRRAPSLAVSAAALVLAAFLPETARADRFAYLFAFFMLGAWAAQNRAIWEPWLRRWAVLLPAALLGVGLAVASAAGLGVQYNPLYAWGVLAAVLAAVAAARHFSGLAACRWFQYLGRNSIVMYVAHWPVMCVGALILRAADAATTPALFTCALVAGVVVPLGLSVARDRWRPVNALFRFPSSSRAIQRA